MLPTIKSLPHVFLSPRPLPARSLKVGAANYCKIVRSKCRWHRSAWQISINAPENFTENLLLHFAVQTTRTVVFLDAFYQTTKLSKIKSSPERGTLSWWTAA